MEGTYGMEHWVWCINNEFCYAGKKFKKKNKSGFIKKKMGDLNHDFDKAGS